jgi:tetraacyldisaccharide 4'-kinase
VVVHPDRVAAADVLLARNPVDLLISDDGLQHYRLERQVEIAVVDGDRRFGNGRLLPAGPLREPPARLDEVDLVVCNGTAPLPGEFGMRLIGTTAVSVTTPARRCALRDFRSGRVHAVAGIGNPGRFFDHLRAEGLEPVEHPFPDHHRFVAGDLIFSEDLPVIMTEKDAVKCGDVCGPDVWYVPVTAELDPEFASALVGALRSRMSG